MTPWGTEFRLLNLPSHLLAAEAKALETSVSNAMDISYCRMNIMIPNMLL